MKREIILIFLVVFMLVFSSCTSSTVDSTESTTKVDCGSVLGPDSFSSVKTCFDENFETCSPAVMSIGGIDDSVAYSWEILGLEDGTCKLKNWHSAAEEGSPFYNYIGEEMYCYFEDYAEKNMQPSADKCEGPLAKAYGY